MSFRSFLRSEGSAHRHEHLDAPAESGVGASEMAARKARALARAGRAAEAAGFYREAAGGFAETGRPVQAIAAAIEAGWLDPRSDSPSEEAVKAVRQIGRPVEPVSGQTLIGSLEPFARESLVARLHPVSYATDTLLARQEDSADALWFVVRGRLHATRRGRRGGPVTVRTIGPGELVGESSLVGGGLMLATLVCEEPTDLLELRRSDLETLLKAHSSLQSALERLQTSR